MPSIQHELIPISKRGEQEQWVDARTLHLFLESKQEFANWIKNRIDDFSFIEGRDFVISLSKSTGGRNATDYTITLDMAKELAMLERNEKGKAARQYFIAAEKELRRIQTALLSGYAEVQQLLEQCEKRELQGFIWYPIGQLRRLAGKSNLRSHNMRRKKELLGERITKMSYRGWETWWVRNDAVHEVLCVKPNQIMAVAMVKLLNTGGISW